MMFYDVCPRCAVRTVDYENYESKAAARRAGVIGDTRNHTPEDCIKHLASVIDALAERAMA